LLAASAFPCLVFAPASTAQWFADTFKNTLIINVGACGLHMLPISSAGRRTGSRSDAARVLAFPDFPG